MSRSASSHWRRWPRVALASSPTREGCEVVPVGERVGLRFNGGDAEHLGVMIERLLVDESLRERLVTEASEHVLRFDWDDIAQRTRGIYSELRELTPREEGVRRG